MSNPVLDQNIDSLVSSYESAERRLILDGSDEHLDIILEIQGHVKELIQLTISVNEELEETFNGLNQESAQRIVIKLSQGLSLARHLLRILKTQIHPSIYLGIKSCTKELVIHTNEVEEFLQDIIRYKLNEPTDLIELLKDIK